MLGASADHMDDVADFSDLLENLGFDSDLISAMSRDGHMGALPVDAGPVWDEVQEVVGEYARDLDSPFESVPLTADGRVDIVDVLVRMFDNLGMLPFEFPLSQVRCETFRVHGKLGLLGLFLLFHRSKLGVSDAVGLPCTALAAAYESVSHGGDFDLFESVQAMECETQGDATSKWVGGVLLAFEACRYENDLDVMFPIDLDHEVSHVKSAKRIAKLLQIFCRNCDYERKRCLVGGADKGTSLFDCARPEDAPQAQLRWRLGLFKSHTFQRWEDFGRSSLLPGDGDACSVPNRMEASFRLFCDGLFAKLVREIDGVADCSGVGVDGVFDRCVPSVLTSYAVLGIGIAAVCALNPRSSTLRATLVAANPRGMTSLPHDCLCTLLNDAILARMMTVPVKPLKSGIDVTTREGRNEKAKIDRLPGEAQRDAYLRSNPEINKPFVLEFLGFEPTFPCDESGERSEVNTLQLQAMRSYIGSNDPERTKVIGMTERSTIAQAMMVAPPPSDVSLADTRLTIGNQMSEPMRQHWKDVKDTVVGVRRSWGRYVVLSTRFLCVLRLVCKEWNEHFREFCFHPHVQIASVTELSHDIEGSPALFGGPPRHVLLKSKPYILQVYLRRKVLTADASGDVVKGWEYVPPGLLAVGLNALQITCETEPDSNGRVERFAVGQSLESGTLRTEPFERPKNYVGFCSKESLPSQSLYSMHLPQNWRARRQFAVNSSIGVAVWNRKFPTMSDDDRDFVPHDQLVKSRNFMGAHVRGSSRAAANPLTSTTLPRSWHARIGDDNHFLPHHVLNNQMREYIVVPMRTSKSSSKSSSAAPRAMRFRVEFGRAGDRAPDGIALMKSVGNGGAHPEKITPFGPEERASFRPYMTGASSYVYVSAESMRADAALKRQNRRRRRTDADRNDREQRRKLADEAAHMPEAAVS